MASNGRLNITRLVNGVGTRPENDVLADFGMPDPTRYITHFEDFINYTAADWTVTAVGTGTSALANVNGGVLLTTTSGASGDSRYSQKVGRGFLMATNRRTFFKARFAIDNVATSSLILGLQLDDTTPKDATDGIYFFKNSSNSVDLVARKDATTGSTSVAGVTTLTNNVYTELAYYYDADGVLHYFVDGVERGVVNIANFFPDAQLSMSFGVETNAAATRAMSLDYIFVAQER